MNYVTRPFKMEHACPASLREIQMWLGKFTSAPFQSLTTFPLVESESNLYIKPSVRLKSYERAYIYHEQYWFRLLKTLQENFPSLVALFGYPSFNEMVAIPYLSKYPSQEWTLSELGCKLPQWIRESYHEKDKELIEALSIIDRAVTISFSAGYEPPLSLTDIEGLEDQLLCVQPHVQIFAHAVNLFKFREQLLEKPVEHWQENDFPQLEEKEYFTLLFRNVYHKVVWRTLTLYEYNLLKKFKIGATLYDALETENANIEWLIKSFKEWAKEKLLFKPL